MAAGPSPHPEATPVLAGADPEALRRPRHRVTGMSAVLLPFGADGAVDWAGFEAHVARTVDAGLVPAVNMDTGYGPLLDGVSRERVLRIARGVARGRDPAGIGVDFVAGALVADAERDPAAVDAHVAAAEVVVAHGGVPVVFPSWGLSALAGPDWVGAHQRVGAAVGRHLAFELGRQFVPHGRIHDLDTYAALLEVGPCIGAKHSSLARAPEWDRLALRDARRPEFLVLTGNDLAIDMVRYGSDYLLGLSTFAPDLFARRDALLVAADPAAHELEDALQYLGAFAFRDPVPAYRHDAAMFLRLRGWIGSDATPPGMPRRPGTDRAVLRGIGRRLGVLA